MIHLFLPGPPSTPPTDPLTVTLQLVANFTLVYLLIVLCAFLFVYGALMKWRKTEGGRSVFYFLVSLFFLLVNNYLGVWIPTWVDWTRQGFRDVIFISVAAAFSRMFYVLFRRFLHATHDNNLSILIEEKTTPPFRRRK